MPTYEYRCRQCDLVFSLDREMNDRKKPARCGGCGAKKSELLVSACSFALVGGGWSASGYSTRGTKDKK